MSCVNLVKNTISNFCVILEQSGTQAFSLKFVYLFLLCVAHCSASDNSLVLCYVEGVGLVQIPRSRLVDPDHLARVRAEEYAAVAPAVQALIDALNEPPRRFRAVVEAERPILYMDPDGKAHASLE